MALGNYYLGQNGLTDDTLDRVAFKIINDDGNLVDSYYFNVNPSNMTASYPARNIFNETLDDVLMQGYGLGIHTIQLQGQTGFMKYAVQHRGPTGWGTGFQKAKRLQEILLRQINNAHDVGTPEAMTTLYFCNYTDDVIYKVEPDKNGIQFNQTSNDPLTFYYTISLVVIAAGNQPNPDEETLTNLGNWAVPGARTSYPISTIPGNNGGPEFDHGGMFRHPGDEAESNLQKAQEEVDKYDHGRKSILDWQNYKDKEPLEVKQPLLNQMAGLPNNAKAGILNTINNASGNNPLVHVTYNGRRPFDIALPSKSTNSNMQYWQDWVNATNTNGTNDIGINDNAPTGYNETASEDVRTQPNGDKLIYPDASSTEPEAVITNQGTMYYLNGQNNSDTSTNDQQHVLVDSNGHVMSAPQGRNIQFIINYDLYCFSHVVQLAPGNPADHRIGESFLDQDIHHATASVVFTWGQPNAVPVNYMNYYKHTGSKGEWTCTTQVEGHGTIYWDGQGNISSTQSSTPNGDSFTLDTPGLVITSYQVANSNNTEEATPLNLAEVSVPSTSEEMDLYPNNSIGNANDINPSQVSTASNNYVVNSGVINTQYVDTILDADLKSYYAQNASNYKVNGATTTPPYMTGSDISAQTNNDFNFDFQSALDNNMPLQMNGGSVNLQSAFQGNPVPTQNVTDSSYWQSKGQNYITDRSNHVNPALDTYIRYWIAKNISPSVVNQSMQRQAQMQGNTANQIDENGTVNNGWYYPYGFNNTSNQYDYGSTTTNGAYTPPTNSVYGYYDKDGNIVYDDSHSNSKDFLIPTGSNTQFQTQSNGNTIIVNPSDSDTASDEAVNTNDIGNSNNPTAMNSYYSDMTNNVEHATWQDGHLLLDPYGKIIVPINGTHVVGILLNGNIVPNITYVLPPDDTDQPVPDYDFGDDYLRAKMIDGQLIPDPDGNVLVPSNGNQIQEDSNGNAVITNTGSNTTSNSNPNIYRADSINGNLYLDKNGNINVPTSCTRIENVNGRQRLVGLDGSNDWIICFTNINDQLTPNSNGNVYVPRSEVFIKTGSNKQEIITGINGDNPIDPSDDINNATNQERASIDPMGNLYLDPRGSVYVPQNGTSVVGKVVNGVSEQVITDVGSNTTAKGNPIPDNEKGNASDTETASMYKGKLVLDPNGSIIVTKNGTMTQKDPTTGLIDIINTGSNTTASESVPANPTIDYGNSNFQYIQNADGAWVLVPKNGVEIINNNGHNYVVNTGSNTTNPGPPSEDNLANNALTTSQMITDSHGKITILPAGYSTNDFSASDVSQNDAQYATDLTTIIDKNHKLVVVPNQYSTTDPGNPVPVNLAKNSTNWIQVKLKNGQLQIIPSNNTPDNQPSHDYGLKSGYMITDVNGKIQYAPLGSDTNGKDDSVANVAHNASNWAQVQAEDGKITVNPISPGSTPQTTSFLAGQTGSHTELINNHFVIVPDTQSALNTVNDSNVKETTTIVDDNIQNPSDNSIPVDIESKTNKGTDNQD